MKKVIKDANDLPEWFDLKKYHGVKLLDMSEWARQISIRSLVWGDLVRNQVLVDDTLANHPMDGPIDFSLVDHYLKKIENDPIYPNGDDRHLDFRVANSEEKPYDICNVWSMSLHFAYNIGSGLVDRRNMTDKELSLALDALDNNRATPDQLKLLSAPIDLYDKQNGVSGDGLCHLIVDLSASDQQIREEFSHWLTQFREAIGIQAISKVPAKRKIPKKNRVVSPVTERDLYEWNDLLILPYVDLKLWSLANDCRITSNVLADTLYRGRHGNVEEQIRDTIEPKAQRILNQDFARAFDRQVDAIQLKKKVDRRQI
jgi:hypothetical protein